MRAWQVFLLVGALVALAVLAAGCGSAGPSDSSHTGALGPSPGGVPNLVDTLAVGAYPDPQEYYRYRDMLDHRYTGSPTDGSYGLWPIASGVTMTYDVPGLVTYELSDGPTLVGSITADGLKPHFAYQVKLEGQPSEPYPWTNDPDSIENWSNEQIGKVGRWWCDTDGWNATDSQLAGGGHNGHQIIGYLLFDFFMTNIDGYATRELYLDSSFHVVWRTDQRRANRVRDGTPRTHRVTPDPNVYESAFANQNVRVYAEGETGRPKPGQVTLPPGNYQCRLLLTEESFHNVPPELQSDFPWGRTNYADGGFWAHVLSDDDFAFTITGGGPSGGAMHVAAIDMALNQKKRFARASATVTVVDANGQPVSEATVSGQWSGLTNDTDSAVTDGSGRCTVSSDRTREQSGTFTFTVDSVSKEGWEYDPSQNAETSDSVPL